MNKRKTYHDIRKAQIEESLHLVISSLPDFASDYFRAISTTTAATSRLSYAYDIRVFFRYAADNVFHLEIKALSLQHMDTITEQDIERFMEYLSQYADSMGRIHKNSPTGITRKLSSLKNFFAYYFQRKLLDNNPTCLSPSPKIRQHKIVRLNEHEIQKFLDFLEHGGDNFSGIQKSYFEKNKKRNLAICTLLLGTGIRVSECVGLDIQDIDMYSKRFRILRKGEKEEYVYFGIEVELELLNYLQERKSITAMAGHENAFFLSSQKKRLSVHAVENMVTTYTSACFKNKDDRITPHKLRSTYGTELYRITNDIYLVAELLGHADVNTTRKHYTDIEDEKKRMAANLIRLRQSKFN